MRDRETMERSCIRAQSPAAQERGDHKIGYGWIQGCAGFCLMLNDLNDSMYLLFGSWVECMHVGLG